jgi:hypothetical protein
MMISMKKGYARVSTYEQNLALQVDVLEQAGVRRYVATISVAPNPSGRVFRRQWRTYVQGGAAFGNDG